MTNVRFYHSDGRLGNKAAGPFDAIMSAAAPKQIPQDLKAQLAMGGRLVLPVGDGEQQLIVVDRDEQGFHERMVEPVHFVPLLSGIQR